MSRPRLPLCDLCLERDGAWQLTGYFRHSPLGNHSPESSARHSCGHRTYLGIGNLQALGYPVTREQPYPPFHAVVAS